MPTAQAGLFDEGAAANFAVTTEHAHSLKPVPVPQDVLGIRLDAVDARDPALEGVPVILD